MIPTEKEIIESINKIDFSPFRVSKITSEPLLIEGIKYYRPDGFLTLEWEGEKKDFLIEVKRKLSPKEVEETILKIKQYLRMGSLINKKYFPLLITPYLREATIERFLQEGISGIDLCGNAIIQVPGKWLIKKLGKPNLFPDSAKVEQIFKGNSSLVTRVFFSKPIYKKVNEIQAEILNRDGEISLGTVSKVLKKMQDELLVSRNENIRLLDPAKLLALLEKNFSPIKVMRSLKGKVSSIDEFFAQAINKKERKEIRTVGNNINLYAVMPSSSPITTIYTDSINKLIADTDFKETERFPNVELQETEDPTVFFDSRKRNNFYWTSPLQVYLELSIGGKRERETAEQIKKNLINFEYKD